MKKSTEDYILQELRKLGGLDGRMTRLENSLSDLRTEMMDRFDRNEIAIEKLQEGFTAMADFIRDHERRITVLEERTA